MTEWYMIKIQNDKIKLLRKENQNNKFKIKWGIEWIIFIVG